jgi:hypothetical protein
VIKTLIVKENDKSAACGVYLWESVNGWQDSYSILASPSDLTDERQEIRNTVNRLNKVIGRRPIITKDVEVCDLFILDCILYAQKTYAVPCFEILNSIMS